MILLTYGTRPEYIKVSPLIKAFKENNIPFKVLFTGQHIDIANFEYDFKLDIIDGVNNRLDSIVTSILLQLRPILINNGIEYVLVQGDTTSAMAVALSAFHNAVKIIHLEAGLRTNDINNPYPEEGNRLIITQIANYHLCPTVNNFLTIIKNKSTILENVFIVGNTGLDNLLQYKNNITYNNKVLVTLHRRENHDILDKWFTEINELAKSYPKLEFILPLHPNPNVQKHKNILTDVNVVEPLKYEKLLELLSSCRLVITDSGGLQEESSFLNKKCLVCRKVTERPEAIGSSSFMVKDPKHLSEVFIEHVDNYKINIKCPFGNGNSAQIIVEVIRGILLSNK